MHLMQLQNLVDSVCDYHECHDDYIFFIRIINFMDECFTFIEPFLDESSLVVKAESKKARFEQDEQKVAELHDAFTKLTKEKRVSRYKDKVVRGRYFSLLVYFCPFDRWKDERTNMIDYFVFDIINAGVSEESICKILKHHFSDIYPINLKMRV